MAPIKDSVEKIPILQSSSLITTMKDNKGQKIHLFNDNQYRSDLLENLNMLRKNQKFCDVILQIGTNHQDIYEIYAHKAVLSSSSPYLFELFMNHEYQSLINDHSNGINNHNHNDKNVSKQKLTIKTSKNDNISINNNNNINNNNVPQQFRLVSSTSFESDPDAFESIIDYAYTSVIKIPETKIREIYSIASRLKMSNITNKCGELMIKMLTIENCLEIRNMKSILNDLNLLKSIDDFIRKNFENILKTSSSLIDSQLSHQIKIEFLLNSEQEENSINDRYMLNEVLEWIRNSFENNYIDLDRFKDHNTILMLHYDKYKNEIQDCCQIETNSPEESEMIEDYKKLNKRISLIKKSLSQDNITSTTTTNGSIIKTPSIKPKQFLFTRSDSESLLYSSSTINSTNGTNNNNHINYNDNNNNSDDYQNENQNEWKVLANCRLGSGNHTLIGLVSIVGGQLCLLSITLRIKESTSKLNSQNLNNKCDKQQNYCLIPPMSSARCAVGTANFKGKLFVCGGYDRGECLKTVEVYDTIENRWQLLQPMQVPRGRFSITVVDDRIYSICGCDGHDELCSAEFYDGTNDVWKSIHNAPVARSNAGVCSMNGKIYLIGGWNGNRGMTRCDIYDTNTDQWSDMAPLNIGRYQTGCCSIDSSTIYSVGGCDLWSCLNTVEQYSDYTKQWRLVSSLQTARRGCGVAAFCGKIFAVGGHDGIHALSSVEIYDPEDDQWTYGKSMTIARANVGVAVINDRLYAVGGFNGKTFLNTIEYYDYEHDEWTTSIIIPESICDKMTISNNNDKNNDIIDSKNKIIIERKNHQSSSSSTTATLGSVMEVEETSLKHV